MKAFILAGGLNRRFPSPKGLIEINGKTIIERLHTTLSEFFKDIYLITNTPEIYFQLSLRMFGDLYDFRCPLTGIFTGLKNSNGPIFITSCDMPFIKKEVVELILSKSDALNNHDAIIPVHSGRVEPLLGIYSISLEKSLRRWLLERRCNMREFIKEIKAYLIDENEMRKVDREGFSFININTPEDLEYIRKTCLIV